MDSGFQSRSGERRDGETDDPLGDDLAAGEGEEKKEEDNADEGEEGLEVLEPGGREALAQPCLADDAKGGHDEAEVEGIAERGRDCDGPGGAGGEVDDDQERDGADPGEGIDERVAENLGAEEGREEAGG